MAFNGSGTFQRLYNWVTDRDASVNITASRMDDEMDGFATGLSTCLTKDGQTTATANLPMGGFRHTGVGASTSRTSYGQTAQIQDSTYTYAAESGAADAYVIALSPAITAYAAGQRFTFIATNANTGASTLNVNSVSAQTINTWYGTALPAGAIGAGQLVDVVYDGTNFILLSGLQSADIAAIIGLTSAANKMIRYTGSGTADLVDFIDEDDMSSDSATALPTQQSVKAYVDGEVASIIPIGGVIAWPTSSVPTNYLECDGSTFSAVTYAALNTLLGGNTLPDLRGEFIRGWDNSRGVDSGRGILSTQAQSVESHTHSIQTFGGTGGTYSTGTLGLNSVTGAYGGAETRPRNVAFMYIMRAL